MNNLQQFQNLFFLLSRFIFLIAGVVKLFIYCFYCPFSQYILGYPKLIERSS